MEEDESSCVRMKKLGAWFYPRKATIEEVSEVARRAKQELKMDYLVVSVPGRELANELKSCSAPRSSVAWSTTLRMLREIKKQDLEVVPMVLQDPRFAFKSQIPNAIDILKTTLEMCRQVGCSEVHFDIEPHTLPEWKKKEGEYEEQTMQRRRAILQELSEVLAVLKQTVEDYNAQLGGGLHLISKAASGMTDATPESPATSSLLKPASILPELTEKEAEELEMLPPMPISISVALPWWMPLRFSDITKKFVVDCTYLMCYGGCGFSIEEVFDKMLKKQRPILTPTVIGIGAEELKNKTCGCGDSIRGCLDSAAKLDRVLMQSQESG